MRFSLLSAFLFAVSAGIAASADPPAAIVAVRSIDAVVEEGRYALELANGGDILATMKQAVDQAGMGKGFGIDTSRPLGAVVTLPGGRPKVVGFIPLIDPARLIELFANLPNAPQKVEEGLYETNTPQKILIRMGKRWAFVGMTREDVDAAQADPETMLSEAVKLNTLVATLNFTALPDEMRQTVLQTFENAVEAGSRAKTPASEFEAKATKALLRGIVDAARAIVLGAENLSFTYHVSKSDRRLAADVALIAKPDSPLAAAFSGLSKASVPLSGLERGKPPLSLYICCPIVGAIREFLETTAVEGKRLVHEEIRKDPKAPALAHEAVDRFFEVVDATTKTGRFDLGAAFTGADGGVRFVVAGRVAKGKELGEVFIDLAKLAPQGEVELSIATHEGITLHRIPKVGGVNGPPKGMPADADAVVGFGSQLVVLAMGRDSTSSARRAVDDLAAPAVQSPGLLASMQMKLGESRKVFPEGQGKDEEFLKHLGKDDRMDLSVVCEPTKLRFQLELQEGYIRMVGAAFVAGFKKSH